MQLFVWRYSMACSVHGQEGEIVAVAETRAVAEAIIQASYTGRQPEKLAEDLSSIPDVYDVPCAFFHYANE